MAARWSSDANPSVRLTIADGGTRKTVLLLMLRGLERTEATNLTAFLCGLRVGDARWTVAEINRLLFLRELHRGGAFGATDRPRAAS